MFVALISLKYYYYLFNFLFQRYKQILIINALVTVALVKFPFIRCYKYYVNQRYK